jgi:hypothetical protein
MKKQVQAIAPTYLEKLDKEFAEFRAEWADEGETEITGAMVARFFRSSENNMEMIREEILDGDQSEGLISLLLETRKTRNYRGYVYKDQLEAIVADFSAEDLKDMVPAGVLEEIETDPTADIQAAIDTLMGWDSRAVFEAIEKWKWYHVA